MNNFNETTLKEYYKNHSTKETIFHFGISYSKIRYYLRKFDIRKEDGYCRKQAWLDIPSQYQKEIIDGMLLGDATLAKVDNKFFNSKIQNTQGNSQKNYNFWKSQELNNYITKEPKQDKKSLNWRFYTRVNPYFTELEKKWYKRDESNNYVLNQNNQRTKIIPQDLKLTPTVLMVWYLDDGYWNSKKRQITLCTECFTREECEFLVHKLQVEFDLSDTYWSNIRKTKPRIYITSKSTKKFIDIIKDSIPCNCMKYKVDLSNYTDPISRNKRRGFRQLNYKTQLLNN